MGQMNDPRLAEVASGTWVKMQYVLRGSDGTAQAVVHWFRNLDNGMNIGFKFK